MNGYIAIILYMYMYVTFVQSCEKKLLPTPIMYFEETASWSLDHDMILLCVHMIKCNMDTSFNSFSYTDIIIPCAIIRNYIYISLRHSRYLSSMFVEMRAQRYIAAHKYIFNMRARRNAPVRVRGIKKYLALPFWET